MSEPVAVLATDRCPRCDGSFHCGMNEAAPCPCTGIALDAATLAQLRQQYHGCLCLACLRSLATGRVPEFPSFSHECS
jgi:hypothetical protein